MLRILRWMVLGLMVGLVAAPAAVWAQSDGISGSLTPQRGPDGDPNGAPFASMTTLPTPAGVTASTLEGVTPQRGPAGDPDGAPTLSAMTPGITNAAADYGLEPGSAARRMVSLVSESSHLSEVLPGSSGRLTLL